MLDLGRGRLFIRSALMKKVLTVPVQIIAKNRELAKVSLMLSEFIRRSDEMFLTCTLKSVFDIE